MTAWETAYTSDPPSLEPSPATHAGDTSMTTDKQNMTLEVSGTAKIYTDLTAMLWYVVPPTLLISGTFGNVMTVIVMRGMPSSPSTACLYFYFTALALSDQCVLLTSLIFTWVDLGFSWPPSFFRFDILCLLPKFIWNAGGIVSAWVLVAMTYQRVTSVIAPHRVGIVCTLRRGKIIVAIIVSFGCAVHGQFLHTWVYWPEHGKCQYREEYLHFTEFFEWLDLLFASMLPFVWLVAGNSVLLWQIIKSSQLSRTLRAKPDQPGPSKTDPVYSMTRTLIVTSVVFLVLTLPVTIVDVCLQMTYMNISDPEVTAMIKLIRSTVKLMWISAGATNFYLYILSGRRFREETAKYLCCGQTDLAR